MIPLFDLLSEWFPSDDTILWESPAVINLQHSESYIEDWAKGVDAFTTTSTALLNECSSFHDLPETTTGSEEQKPDCDEEEIQITY